MNLNMAYQPEVLVKTAGLSESEWLRYRGQGIGGSDAAIVLGLSPYRTARDLYLEKTGTPVEKDNADWVAMEYGKRLEGLVAEIFAHKTGLRVYQELKMLRHPLYPFMLANVDYFVEMPDQSLAILECKTTGNYGKDRWDDETVPIHYEIQCRHYMSVTNLNMAFIACLYGNNGNDFMFRAIKRDLDYESDIIEQEQYFWEQCVQARVEPPFTEQGDLVLDSLRRYYRGADSSAETLSLDNSFSESIEKYLSLREEKLALDHKSDILEDQMKRIYAPIVEKMGTACRAVCLDGKTQYDITYNPVCRKVISKDKLIQLELSHPMVYAEYVSSNESRRFSVKKKTAV